MSVEDKQYCPVEQSLNLISKKWVVLIIRDIFFGKKHFNEFKEDKPELTNNVLSRCLKKMEEDNLIIKKVDPNNIRDTEYVLTQQGLDLNRIIYDLAVYSLKNDEQCCSYYDNATREAIRKFYEEKLIISDSNSN